MSDNNWFEVSREGLRALWAGKPSSFIARELVQNAWDEADNECRFSATWLDGVATIEMWDDSPTGFRDLSHAFTLFAPTYKRKDPKKRGRFNLGEKQVLALANEATIRTTTGTLYFSKDGRKKTSRKTDFGSVVAMVVPMTKKDRDAMVAEARSFIPPKGIEYYVEGELVSYREPLRSFKAKLKSEIESNGTLRRSTRITEVELHEEATPRLYEMGLPICEIDCEYSIDVQQKVPLASDRETVSAAYLRRLYAEVLNHTHDLIEEEKSSETWIRVATTDEKVSDEAVRDIVKKRYGDKVAVATFDPIANDDALAAGYRVVRGNELSSEEWDQIRRADAIDSTTKLFGHEMGSAPELSGDAITDEMKAVAALTSKISMATLGFAVRVRFVKFPGGPQATYGGRVVTFNTSYCRFENPLDPAMLSLIIHELGHERGHHTEARYHQALSDIGAKLIRQAIEDREFFFRL